MRDENVMHMRRQIYLFILELIHDLRNPLGKISESN